METRALTLKSIVVTIVVLACDQALKLFVRQSLAVCAAPFSDCERIDLAGPVGLMRLENAGSALGFLQGLWVWLLVALLGLIAVPFYGRRLRDSGLVAPLGLGLQIGGASGNLVDRILYGSVTDFFDIGSGVAFNLADVALLLGMVLAVRALLRPAAQKSSGTGPATVGADSETGDARQPLVRV